MKVRDKDAPARAQKEIAENVIRPKMKAEDSSEKIWPDNGAKRVEYSVNP